MPRHRPSHRRPPVRRPGPVAIEAVEPRTLMSVAALPGLPATVSPSYLRADLQPDGGVTSPTVVGYTPAQVRTAYGFDGLTFGSGRVAADGAGQTIALIDAYNDPDLVADLKVFDAQFGLAAPPSLRVVNQTGGTTLPKTDPDWAGEIALDVEWAHAIAPDAAILLVEADTDDTPDLLAAVNFARSAAGVSVVSMSWGGSEFEDTYSGGETSTQTAYDADFTTPLGHQGVTFVSAAGDSGQQAGVQWPASSPNVLGVGGTTLTVASDGTYTSETGWSGTSSGYSQVEAEPAFQDKVQTTGLRSVADVAYGADPDDGYAVYDSLLDAGVSGWQEVGGTSAGTPQWSALVAVANQGRVIAGAATLNGTTQTLPDLYGLYAAPGTAGYAAYAADFNDVTTGGAGQTHFRHGGTGSTQNSAAAGYDLVTGLGTPKAAALIADLATAAADTGTGGTSAPAQTLSPIGITLTTAPPATVVGGAVGTLGVRLSNSNPTAFVGQVTLVLYASTDAAVSDSDTVVRTVTLGVHLPAGSSRGQALRFTYPNELPTASYHLIAQADAAGTGTTPTTAVTAPVTINAPTVDLSVAFAATSVAVKPGKRGHAVLRLTNLGNVTAAGPVVVDLYASTTGAVDATAVLLTHLTRKVKLPAGRTLSLSVPFAFPAAAVAGSVDLVAAIGPTTTPTDDNPGNDVAAVPTTAA